MYKTQPLSGLKRTKNFSCEKKKKGCNWAIDLLTGSVSELFGVSTDSSRFLFTYIHKYLWSQPPSIQECERYAGPCPQGK